MLRKPLRVLAAPHLGIVCLGVLLLGGGLRAENVDPGNTERQYSWGENVGWFNAEPLGNSGPGVQVTDTALTGWIWSENTGWVSLSCQNTSSCGTASYGVVNDGRGLLSGFAWSENLGWINFRSSGSDCCAAHGTAGCTNATCQQAVCNLDPFCCNVTWDAQCAAEANTFPACTTTCSAAPFGVRIGATSGDFSGFAWSENAGWINFGASTPAGWQVKTGWTCDPDADGICSVDDNCANFPNPGQGAVAFGQIMIAVSKTQFAWVAPGDYVAVSGPFSPTTSIGAFVVSSGPTAVSAGLTDPSNPTTGTGRWYLVRPNCGVGSYSTGSVRELPGRDAALP